MSTTTKTATKASPPAAAPVASPSDPRRSPLASPTAEPKTNPLDAAAPKSTPADSKSDSVPAVAADDDDDDDDPDADIIDMDTFNQILELEEDDTYEFSLGMLQAYLTQAEETFTKMDKALAEENLSQLKDLGHFLKGSSAALGVHKVQHSCEKMQQYGKSKDATGSQDIPKDVALARIRSLLARVKKQFEEAKVYLEKWYKAKGIDL